MASITLRPTSDSRQTRVGVDWWLIGTAALLTAIGVVCIFSSSPTGGYYKRQMIYIVVGVVPMSVFSFVHPRFWQRFMPVIYAVINLLLLLLLFVADEKKGAGRWIEVGPMQFQPSEVAKILLAITLASFYAKRMDRIRDFTTFAGGLGHVLLPAALIFKQPHLASAALIFTLWFAISLAAGVRPLYVFGLLGLIGTIAFGLVVSKPLRNAVLQPYQAKRIEAMIDKRAGKEDRKGDGFQQHQALLAFANGGVTGTGFLKGEMKRRVPEQHNDFIFSLIGEEFGLFGAVGVIGLFGLLFYRLWLGVVYAADDYYKMLVAGILTVLAFHTILNIGMVIGIAPVAGMWCPFLSSGGTALWLCMSLIGLAVNVRLRERNVLF